MVRKRATEMRRLHEPIHDVSRLLDKNTTWLWNSFHYGLSICVIT